MTVKARDGDRGIPRKIVYELVTSKLIDNPLIKFFRVGITDKCF